MRIIALSFIPLLLYGIILPVNQSNYYKTQGIMHTVQEDGPYILYKNNQVFIKYILNDHGRKLVMADSIALSQKEALSLSVNTDEPGKFFQVQLKKKLENEKSEFKKISKQIAISDIEGNFGAFRKLLQANHVIDGLYNWTFGDGHLVLTGDFFDRGNQVTEVLWLIYSLEEKAKAAGGYVHFVLGNHEIMNLNGDIRYVNAKYKENAGIMGENYVDLFGKNSELGRWLRTKNIAEKVGDILYVHGGISEEVNKMRVSISDLNEMARPLYDDSSLNYSNKKLEIIYGNAGPFWYRGYYTGDKIATKGQIDSTIKKFGISRIATGHTVVSDTISSWHGGKLFNTDVHHAKGHSEALLIENDKFYRVNSKGEKFLIKN